MCQFIETIRIERGVVYNLDYHTERMNQTRAVLARRTAVDTMESLKPIMNVEMIKCRVVYSRWIEEILYTPFIKYAQYILYRLFIRIISITLTKVQIGVQ